MDSLQKKFCNADLAYQKYPTWAIRLSTEMEMAHAGGVVRENIFKN